MSNDHRTAAQQDFDHFARRWRAVSNRALRQRIPSLKAAAAKLGYGDDRVYLCAGIEAWAASGLVPDRLGRNG